MGSEDEHDQDDQPALVMHYCPPPPTNLHRLFTRQSGHVRHAVDTKSGAVSAGEDGRVATSGSGGGTVSTIDRRLDTPRGLLLRGRYFDRSTSKIDPVSSTLTVLY